MAALVCGAGATSCLPCEARPSRAGRGGRLSACPNVCLAESWRSEVLNGRSR